MTRPLEGIRVVDLTMYLAGPSAGMTLADWGADVIKMEGLKGDTARSLGSAIGSSSPYNYWWEVFNRNKRGIALDLLHPKGQEIVFRLVKGADIFLSNLRGSSLSRMGFTYENLSQINPRLVYCHSTALGPRGPEKDKMGFDSLSYWARAGFLAIHGEPDSSPAQMQAALGDLPTGMFLAAGCLLGLAYRQKTGKGVEVNGSLLASGVYVNAWAIHEFLGSGKNMQRVSRQARPYPLLNIYQTKDGWLALEMYGERVWQDLCRALGREDLLNDPRFNTEAKRSENCRQLTVLLDKIFSSLSTEEWKARLRQYDLGWEPAQTPDQVAADPQVKANDYLVELDHPVWGRHKQIASPLQFHKTPFTPYRPAPEFGQHTEEVLREIGYSQPQVEELEKAGVIRCGQRVGEKK